MTPTVKKVIVLSESRAPVWTPVGNLLTDTNNLTTYDFGNVDVGAEGLVTLQVMASAGANAGLGSASIGGSAATVHVTTTGVLEIAAIASRVASGLVNISLTFSGGVARAGVAVGVLRNYKSATPHHTALSELQGSATTQALTLNLPRSGLALFSHARRVGLGDTVWSSATERNDVTVESAGQYVSADKLSNGEVTGHVETLTFASSTHKGFVGVSWQ